MALSKTDVILQCTLDAFAQRSEETPSISCYRVLACEPSCGLYLYDTDDIIDVRLTHRMKPATVELQRYFEAFHDVQTYFPSVQFHYDGVLYRAL